MVTYMNVKYLLPIISLILFSSLAFAQNIEVTDHKGDIEVLLTGTTRYVSFENKSIDNALSVRTLDGEADINIFDTIEVKLYENSEINLKERTINGKAYITTKSVSNIRTGQISITTEDSEYLLDTTPYQTFIKVQKGSAKISNQHQTLTLEQFQEVTATSTQISEPENFKKQGKNYRWLGYIILFIVIFLYLWFKRGRKVE